MFPKHIMCFTIGRENQRKNPALKIAIPILIIFFNNFTIYHQDHYSTKEPISTYFLKNLQKIRGCTKQPLKCLVKQKLLKFNLCASFFELCLHSFSVILSNSFLNSLRCAVNKSLCFLKTKTCDFTNSLDNIDFA